MTYTIWPYCCDNAEKPSQFNTLEIHTPREQVHGHLVSKLHFTYAKVEIEDNNSLSW